jgi:hypothetical protein
VKQLGNNYEIIIINNYFIYKYLMCIDSILFSFFYRENVENIIPKITSSTRETQTEDNKRSVISQTELNIENLMDANNEDWYKYVWTNPTWDKELLINFNY